VSLKSLVLLGIGGGIVPCGEAIFLFTLTVQWQRVDLAFPLLLSFSFGLALVLVGVGVAVVYARRFSIDRLGESPTARRISRALPIVSAVIVTVLGLWLCYNSLHGTGSP
jgi:ABC-type nickel/cobalt efflux system permease component RcnA